MSWQCRSIRRSIVPVTLVLAVCLTLAAPSHALAEATFDFMSRGWGHGIGLSQYGAKAFADRGYTFDRILHHYYGNAESDPKTTLMTLGATPTRDVNLDKNANYSAGGNSGYTRNVWTLRPGTPGDVLAVYSGSVVYHADGWTSFTADGYSIVVTDAQGSTLTYPGTEASPATVAVWGSPGIQGSALTQVKEPTGNYAYSYVRYRGELRVIARAGLLKLVNRLPLEHYLYGVVPQESSASWPAEALKSQAVAARGYAYTSTRTELYPDTRDQVYGGHSRGEDRANPTMSEQSSTNAAVDATARRIVAYDGDAVRTYFFSTSGGYTENNENVWSGSPLPYLRGVPDPFEVYAGSSRHSWTYQSHTASDLRSRLLGAGIPADLVPSEITGVRVTGRGVSGRVTSIQLSFAGGVTTSISGSTNVGRFKNALGFGDRWFYVGVRPYSRADSIRTTRLSGQDRYDTSVRASQSGFPSGTSTVIIANGAAPADALAASALAGAVGGAPILLTPSSELDSRVELEMQRLGATKAYLVGGEGVLSRTVQTDADDVPGIASVVRLAGADRYGTAHEIAEEIKRLEGSVPRVIVVSGESLADAVAVAGLAYAHSMPIVPVRSGSAPEPSVDTFSELEPVDALAFGGAAVVSDAVLSELGARRVAAGADRYATAVAIADYVCANEGFNWGSVYFASGSTLVDALSAGPLTGDNRNVLLFGATDALPAPTRTLLESKMPSLWRCHIIGGEGAVSGWIQGQLEALWE